MKRSDRCTKKPSTIEDEILRRETIDHARRSEAFYRIKGMVELAKSEREIVAYVDRFDSDPFKLTVENGTIDLRTRQLQPHDPSDYITKLAPVVYSETATSALWERFIADITCQDKSLQEYLQRIFGYCLTTYHLLASKKLIEKRMVLPQ